MSSSLHGLHLGPGCHQANGFLFLSLLFFILQTRMVKEHLLGLAQNKAGQRVAS